MFLDFKGHFNVRTICIYSFIFCWSRIVENNDSNRMGYLYDISTTHIMIGRPERKFEFFQEERVCLQRGMSEIFWAQVGENIPSTLRLQNQWKSLISENFWYLELFKKKKISRIYNNSYKFSVSPTDFIVISGELIAIINSFGKFDI